MASDLIKLRAKAKSLGIEGYRTMSADDLTKAVKSAEGKSGSTGRKAAKTASVNGRKAGRKTAKKGTAKTARKTAAKSKPKTAARKTASVKSAPAKSAKSGRQAKRPATGAKKSTPKAQTSGDVGRVGIVNSEIDWTAESNVGTSGGNREVIMKLLRKHKGDVEKVHAKLADNAQSMYPKTDEGKKRSKASALTLLRWHISRVKFDFVKDTNQHEGIVRSDGSTKPQRAAKPKGKSGATRKPAGRKKSAQAPARKPKTAGRKSAASRKRR